MPTKSKGSGAQGSQLPKPTKKKDGYACVDCGADLDNSKIKSIQCDVCETWYCLKCTKIKAGIFDAISEDPNILWTCTHCNIALPGLKKVLSKLTTFEEKFDKMEKQIASLQKGISVDANVRDVNNNLDGSVHKAVQEVLVEEREIEKRRLNVIVHGLPESAGDDNARKEADEGKVDGIVNDTLLCHVVAESCERIGKDFAERKNPRPIRLVVKTFEEKRRILDSARKLKNDTTHSNVFFSPDLTKKQREQSFYLRQEKRERIKGGETGLIIRRGKVVKAQDYADHSYSGAARGPTVATKASSESIQL